MTAPRTAPYGTWRSPITTELMVAETVGLGSPTLDGDAVYWLESRPSEAGRVVLMRRTPDDEPAEISPRQMSVRTRVHEYGGGAYAVRDGCVWFVNLKDQRLYHCEAGGEAVALTPEADLRYADLVPDARGGRLFAVREDHRGGGEPENTLVELPTHPASSVPAEGRVLVSGRDFCSTPRPSPDGRRLAWLAWDHPNMPWDGTELWVAELDNGRLRDARRVAGGPAESVFQPEWSPDGRLHFVSDRTRWWNLYRAADAGDEALCPMEAELGMPQWVFGMRTYAFIDARRVLCAYTRNGTWSLAEIDTATGQLTVVDVPYTEISGIHADHGTAVLVAGAPTEPTAIVRRASDGTRTSIRRASDVRLDPGYLSTPEPMAYPTRDGSTGHALYYPPRNRDHEAPTDERPPVLVKSHGGPTAATSSALNLEHQYWTSRGFAVLDVNYGGSTGYGRTYRDRLKGQWGIVDVDDCVDAVRHLIARDAVDPGRTAIRGSSAGGYTTLAALTFRNTFRAGCSRYGVSDLEALAAETHKFESRYLDQLVGPYPARRDTYRERSPLRHAERLDAPMLFLQGLEDRVVPPNQAERMVEALRARSVPVAYVTFPDEAHGFRAADSIRRSLETELYFYGRVFGFTPADNLEPVPIDNLDR